MMRSRKYFTRVKNKTNVAYYTMQLYFVKSVQLGSRDMEMLLVKKNVLVLDILVLKCPNQDISILKYLFCKQDMVGFPWLTYESIQKHISQFTDSNDCTYLT